MTSLRNKIVSLALIAVILVSTFPTAVLATELESKDSDSIAVEEIENESSIMETFIDEEASEESIINSSDNIETYGISAPTYIFGVDFEQKKINYTDITVTLPSYEALMELGLADSITVTATMSYKGKTVQSAKKTVALSKIKAGSFTMTLPTYGKFDVTATFSNGGKVVATNYKQMVGIVAEEYNLAILNATFPVTQFTLSLWDIKENSNGEPIPTFVSLSRNAAYDWNKLPKNVYGLPLIEDGAQADYSFTKKQAMYCDFVRDLYTLNPDSKFNLYTVDYSISSVLMIMYKNNIPIKNYSIYVMSDGTASYYNFNNMFNDSNAQATYSKMAAEWNNLKKSYGSGSYVSLKDNLSKYTGSSDTTGMKNYAYVIIKEEKDARTAAGCSTTVEWWLTRNDTLLSEDTAFQTEARSYVTIKNLAQALSHLTEAEGAEFKALFHFSEEMFSEAEKQNKKAMMILGTRVTNEKNFMDYARFVMAYYGDKYVYYYKGHPGSPTGLYPSKQEELDALNIIDIDSSIAAEIILYFNPDISMSGYGSTTFLSASSETACGLFGMSKADAYADINNTGAYADRPDFFISPITDFTTAEGKLCNKNNTNYLVEFQDNSGNDIAIYDATAQVIYYYKISSGKYVLTGKTVTKAPVAVAKPGYNEVSLTWSPVDGADKYRVYSYNNSTGEYTRLTETTATSYKHKGLKDGTTYTYLVRSFEANVGSAYTKSNHVSATTAPAAPVVKTKSTTNSITLSWNPVKGADKYRIYEFNTDTNQFVTLGYTTETSTTISKLKAGTSYKYLVRAYNNAGYSNFTRSENLITVKTLCEAPKVIANGGSKSVTINWTPAFGATSYKVYSYNPSTGKYTGLANTKKTSYTVTDLKDGTSYTYLVRAYNGTDSSLYSNKNLVSVKTKCAAPKVTYTATASSITLNWKAVTGATSYRIYSYNTKTGQYTGLANTSKTSFTVTGLKSGTSYTYLVRANNGAVYSPYSSKDNVSAMTLCSAPKVTATAGRNSVTLNWKPVTGAKQYRIYSYDPKTGTYTGLGNTTGTSFTATGLKRGTNYTYLVRAYNGTAYSTYTRDNNLSVKTK